MDSSRKDAGGLLKEAWLLFKHLPRGHTDGTLSSSTTVSLPCIQWGDSADTAGGEVVRQVSWVGAGFKSRKDREGSVYGPTVCYWQVFSLKTMEIPNRDGLG